MEIILRNCEKCDIEALAEFSQRAFRDSFGQANTKKNMDAYIGGALSLRRLQAETAEEGSSFYLLEADGKLAGYLKLNEADAQTDIRDERSLEIERIYIGKELKGRGFGSVLMDKAVSEARLRGKAYVWLGVWENNESAITFYKKHGFRAAGEHTFTLGDDIQTDIIMRKDI